MNDEQLQTLVRFAILAPSSHNTQPWRFRVAASYVDVVADKGRALPENDPNGRELAISGGCALMNLRIAAGHFGLDPEVHLLPDGEDSDTLARVELLSSAVRRFDPTLLDVMTRRRTYRKPFQHRSAADPLIQEMVVEAAREGAWLTIISDEPMRHAIADLVVEGDHVQWSNPRWRMELARWMRPRRTGDGLTIPRFTSGLARLIVRRFDLGRAVARRNRALLEQSPLVATLGSYGDSALDWLATGQALQRVLLWACRQGLQASFLNQPIQVASLREKLTNLLGVAGFPQILLRIGYPTADLRASPRRKLSDVTRMLT